MRSLKHLSVQAMTRATIEKAAGRGPLYMSEAMLQKIPVPTLQETAQRYVKSLQPILSPVELEKTKALLIDFCGQDLLADGAVGNINSSAIGPELQRRLLERADNEKRGWLYNWWTEHGYSRSRCPLPVNVSYCFGHVDDPRLCTASKRAAYIIYFAAQFHEAVATEQLEPDSIRGVPLEAFSYKFLFNSNRKPAPECDTSVQYDLKDNEYVLIIRNDRFFKLPFKVDGTLLSPNELENQISNIIQVADSAGPGPGVGIFTASNRDFWAENYAKLETDNAETIKAIDAAAFVVCLDSQSPVTLDERYRSYLHGNGSNRWFDKPFQAIVNDNGVAGYIMEHSNLDGQVTHRLCEYIANHTSAAQISEKTFQESGLDLPMLATELKFIVNEKLQQAISKARSDFEHLVNSVDLHAIKYQRFGKDQIKEFKCSPDAFVQQIIQYAYYKMYGTNRSTYESASTRKFSYGRTETIRSLTTESVEFCKTMADLKVPDDVKLTKARAAMDTHSKLTKDSSNGRGIDRHFMGLKLSLKPGEPLPELFKDPAFLESNHWYLSTSQVASEFQTHFGFGPVVADGYGVPYMVNKGHLYFGVTCFKNKFPNESNIITSASKFAHFLNEAADDIYELFCRAGKPQSRL